MSPFYGVGKLISLDLSNSKLNGVTMFFRGLNLLQKLDLHTASLYGYSIFKNNVSAFSTLSNLKTLILTRNPLSGLHAGTFVDFSS